MGDVALVERVDGTNPPLTLEEAKTHLRAEEDDENGLLLDLVRAAAEKVEDDRSCVLQKATMKMVLRDWPANGEFVIPRWPLVSVESITYLEDGESTPTTLSSSLYRVEADRFPPRVVLKKDQLFPTATLETGAPITVNFTAGYADGAVPEKARAAVKLLLGHWYLNREAVVTGTIATQIPEAYRSLIMGDRLW